MTLDEFYLKLGGIGISVLVPLIYVAFRFIFKRREVLGTKTEEEYEALRKGKISVKELKEGIWGVNVSKVTAYGAFGLGTVVLTAVFIYEQQLQGYDEMFFNILLSIVSISVITYFLSLQLWFFVFDQGGTVETRILYRKQATIMQSIGWYTINLSIVIAVLLVNTWVGYVFGLLNGGAFIYLTEIKYFIHNKELQDGSGMNEFQNSLDIEEVYPKNEGYTFKEFSGNSLKIVNWNVERGFYPDQIIEFIQVEDPDIVSLQEVDWGNDRTDKLDVLEVVSEKLDMKGYFAIEFFEIDSPYRSEKNGGGGVHGNAILTKYEPISVYRIELPNIYDWENPPKGFRKNYAKAEKRIGQRFAICADFEFEGKEVTVCSSHFEDKGGGADGRLLQLKTIVEELDDRMDGNEIRIIAGDFNTLDTWFTRIIGLSKSSESSIKPWYRSACKWWKESILPQLGYSDPFTCQDWTYRIFLYKQKLDWVLIRNTKILDFGLGEFNKSDHKPLWVEISLEN